MGEFARCLVGLGLALGLASAGCADSGAAEASDGGGRDPGGRSGRQGGDSGRSGARDGGWDPDADADGDGLSNGVEGDRDTDEDGIPDYLDEDSDDDGIADRFEGDEDPNDNGVPAYLDPEERVGLPVVEFTAAAVVGEAPLKVRFENLTEPGAKKVRSYLWDFGDGQSSTKKAPAHEYTEPGSYTVRLEAESEVGTSEAVKQDFVVIVGVEREVLPVAPYALVEEVEFNDNPSDATPVELEPPFALKGAIAQDVDGDYYRFEVTVAGYYTVGLQHEASSFLPQLAFADEAGRAIPGVAIDFGGAGMYQLGRGAYLEPGAEVFVIVNDKNSRGAPEFEYFVDLFLDSDSDGLSDELEVEVGSDPEVPDADHDGLLDAAEFFVLDDTGAWRPDFDADGLANWLDEDADGDGLRDLLEGAADVDADGFSNFVDFDADGSLPDDRMEGGPDLARPLDTDRDRVWDFLDVDNDGDLVVDAIDDDLLTPLKEVTEGGPRVDEVLDPAHPSNRSFRPGQAVVALGSGFIDDDSQTLAVLSGRHGIQNVVAEVVSAEELHFQIPELAPELESVAVYAGGALSNSVALEVVADRLPFLDASLAMRASPNDTVTLGGANLDGVFSVSFGGAFVSPSELSEESLVVRVPVNAGSDYVEVRSTAGTSNRIPFLLTHDVAVGIDPATDADAADLEFDWGLLGSVSAEQASEVPVAARLPEVVSVLYGDTEDAPARLLYQALVLPDDSAVELGPSSTATALAMVGIDLASTVVADAWSDVRRSVASLPEVDALAERLEQMSAERDYLYEQDAETSAAVLSAMAAATRQVVSMLEQAAGSLSQPLLSTATIQPVEQYGVGLRQTEQDPDDLTIVNDTQLYLSAEVELKDSGVNVRKHISAPFDHRLIGGQHWGFLLVAGETDLSVPGARGATVEVFTPGLLSERAPEHVRGALSARSLIERAVWPVMSKFVGQAVPPHSLSRLFLDNFPQVLQQCGNLLTQGDVAAMLQELSSILVEDLFGRGAGLIRNVLIREFGEEIAVSIAQRIGLRLTPGFGQLATATDVLGVAVSYAAVADDFTSTPGVLEYEVSYGFEIQTIMPPGVRQHSGDAQISILGEGFSPTSSFFGLQQTYPVLTFVDQADFGNRYELETDASMVAADGKQMLVTLPGEFLESVTGGELEITLSHHGETVSSPVTLELLRDLRLYIVAPNRGTEGTAVTLYGTGFSPRREDNTVRFMAVDGRPTTTPVLRATETSLEVVAPYGVDTGDVTVTVDGLQSNGERFTVNSNAVLIEFGDNGTDTDDTYGLFVDGELIHSMPEPTRSVGPFAFDLPAGEHLVVLRGITAPDDIGTYFISFSGPVLGVRGDALTGEDLFAGVEKRFVLTVGATADTAMRVLAPDSGTLWLE